MPALPTVTLELPIVLEPVAGKTRFVVEGRSVSAALDSAYAQVPVLRHHLTTDRGALRPHVLVLHNGVNLDRRKLSDEILRDGDELVIFQAISGG